MAANRAGAAALLVTVSVCSLTAFAYPVPTVIASLRKLDAYAPMAPLTLGLGGVLYGTGWLGGTLNKGEIFQLVPPAQGKTAWTGTVVHSFGGGTDGAEPNGALLIAPDGSMYGTTELGGSTLNQGEGIGMAYRLVPHGGGNAWSEDILYAFQYNPKRPGPTADAGVPLGALARDKHGNLFGASANGGLGFGTVFELSPQDGGKKWTETVLYRFTGLADGNSPASGVVIGAHGVLYGTTLLGGSHSQGNIYTLTPPLPGGSAWTQANLYSFQGGAADGSYPNAAPIIAADGKLYGTTTFGGNQYDDGFGTVWELAPPADGGTVWTETVIWKYSKPSEGEYPYGGVVFGKPYALYTTTNGGGRQHGRDGVVFKLSPPNANHGAWRESIVADFHPLEGVESYTGLVVDSDGNLFGTTTRGGDHQGGTVFEVTPK